VNFMRRVWLLGCRYKDKHPQAIYQENTRRSLAANTWIINYRYASLNDGDTFREMRR
jgi:hypothetical protein